MLDAVVDRIFAPVLDRVAARSGRFASNLELVSFCMGLGAVLLIARHNVWIGLALFAAARVAAAAVARSGLTEMYRTVAFASLPFALVLDAPERALPAVFLMFGLAANAAASLKLESRLIGESELLVLFLLAAFFPPWFGLIAYAGGVLCFVAAGLAASRRI